MKCKFCDREVPDPKLNLDVCGVCEKSTESFWKMVIDNEEFLDRALNPGILLKAHADNEA